MYAQSSLLKFIKDKKKHSKGNMIGGGDLGSLIREQSGFLTAVFTSLIFQLCLVFVVVKFVPNNESFKKFSILMFIVQLILIICMALIPMPMTLKFVLFTLFSAITGFVLKVALEKVSTEVIETALFSTIVIFALFVVLGLIVSGFGIDFGFLTMFLFGLLLLLVIVRIVLVFMKTSSQIHKAAAVVSLVIFSLFIVYDTNQILQRDYNGDFVTASLDYFLDIINIFLNLVSYIKND
jgi:FtsH-binding integral membrane protein